MDLACVHIGRLDAENESVVVFFLLDDGFAQPERHGLPQPVFFGHYNIEAAAGENTRP